jgi:hypothetical protein
MRRSTLAGARRGGACVLCTSLVRRIGRPSLPGVDLVGAGHRFLITITQGHGVIDQGRRRQAGGDELSIAAATGSGSAPRAEITARRLRRDAERIRRRRLRRSAVLLALVVLLDHEPNVESPQPPALSRTRDPRTDRAPGESSSCVRATHCSSAELATRCAPGTSVAVRGRRGASRRGTLEECG